MTAIDDSSEAERLDDISSGRAADDPAAFRHLWPAEVVAKYELYSYRGAATILAHNFPRQFQHLCDALRALQITTTMVRLPGGNRGPIALYVDTLFDDSWRETRISADLHVKLHHAKRNVLLDQYTRQGYLDGHRIDFVSGRVALDLEWNSKDQTYDRDLYAFSAFHAAGAIDVGIILTRGTSLNNSFFRGLGVVLNKDGTEGTAQVYKKFGASTTWMGKLLYRLDAGRNGGCPVIAVGITPRCIGG